MPDLPHSTHSALAQMWTRLYRDVQGMIEEALVRTLGQAWRGGKLDAAQIAGTLPPSTIPAHQTTHQAGGSDALSALDAGVITGGTLAQTRGGTGVDTSAATDGQLLIG